jgi:modification methylase
MIQMWDELFTSMSDKIKNALSENDGNVAFEAMHCELDKVWRECNRVLKPGSFACINIGDATRTLKGTFQLYPNHSRIINAFLQLGFNALPVILWRKQTNAPNKFMGSGMLPAGAYVTLEHEYILIFRKGTKRLFKSEAEKARRMESAFFWEERNKWFSDVWDFKGASQELNLKELRNRSAAFPFELPYRLIAMYSLYEDVVLDPFMGIGTTGCAAIACGRNSVGIEIDRTLLELIFEQESSFLENANALIFKRLQRHKEFIETYALSKGPVKYLNNHLGFPVFTRQEIQIKLFKLRKIVKMSNDTINTLYEPAILTR